MCANLLNFILDDDAKMSDFGSGNKYGFDAHEDEEWFEVHSSAVTNTNPGSMVYVTIDTTPICPNMTDSDFRKKMLSLRDIALLLVDKRMKELQRWTPDAQSRVSDWFGQVNDATRSRLMSGLPLLRTVLQNLEPKNFMRASPELDKHVGCLPNLKNVDGEQAHVCKPDTATHTICIDPNFCTLRDVNMFGESKLGTIIHECTHFMDSFGSFDRKYGFNTYLNIWARQNPDLAIENADSIAAYVAYSEDVHL